MNFEFDLKKHVKIVYNDPYNGDRYVFYVITPFADEVRNLLNKPSHPDKLRAMRISNFVIHNNSIVKARYLIEEVFDRALVEFEPAIQTI